MISAQEIKSKLEEAIPGIRLELLDGGLSGQTSLVISRDHAFMAAMWLRDHPQLKMDFCSNVTGVDWLATKVKEKVKIRQMVDGTEKEVEKEQERDIPGYLEAVYHLYSIQLKLGPVIIRVRTVDRENTVVPSLTPVWRGAEFQEREIFDLYGIRFEGHPDLRRILMWENFKDHPMRKDYVQPDDYEYEPTPHEEVLERAKQHYPRPLENP